MHIYLSLHTIYYIVQQTNKLIVKEYKLPTCNAVLILSYWRYYMDRERLPQLNPCTRLKNSKFGIVSQWSSKESQQRRSKLNFLLENGLNFHISCQIRAYCFPQGDVCFAAVNTRYCGQHTTEAPRAIRSTLPMMLCGLLSNFLGIWMVGSKKRFVFIVRASRENSI